MTTVVTQMFVNAVQAPGLYLHPFHSSSLLLNWLNEVGSLSHVHHKSEHWESTSNASCSRPPTLRTLSGCKNIVNHLCLVRNGNRKCNEHLILKHTGKVSLAILGLYNHWQNMQENASTEGKMKMTYHYLSSHAWFSSNYCSIGD